MNEREREMEGNGEKDFIKIYIVDMAYSIRIHNNDKRHRWMYTSYVSFIVHPIFPSVTLHILIEKQESRLDRIESNRDVALNYI